MASTMVMFRLALLISLGLVGCSGAELDFADYHLVCDAEVACPGGFVCQSNECIPEDLADFAPVLNAGGEGEGETPTPPAAGEGEGEDAPPVPEAGEGEGEPPVAGEGEGDGQPPAPGEGEGEGEGEGDGEPPAPVATTATLTLTPPATRVGDPTDADCVVRDADGGVMADVATTLSVDPADGVTIVGPQMVATVVLAEAADYAVRCVVDGTELSDDAAWTVTAGTTARLNGAPEGLQVVRNGDALSVDLTGVDAHGNPTQLDLSWDIAGDDYSAVAGEAGVVLGGSGITTLTATDLESGVGIELMVGVDATAPVITISSPDRGAFVDAAGPLVIEGQVLDDVGVGSFELFGQAVAPDEDGFYTLSLPAPVHGMNIVQGTAIDLVERSADTSRAVLFGDFASPDEFRDDAVRVGLNPALLDDDDPDMDDLSAIAEVALSPDGRDGGSFGTDCDGRVFFTNLQYRDPEVDMWPEDGGIGIRVTVFDMSMDYTGRGCVSAFGNCQCTDFDDTLVAASVTVEADASLLVDLCGLSSESVPDDPEVEGLDLGLEGEQAQYEGLVQARAEQEVGDTATELLLDIVEGAVDRALSQVAVAGTSGRALSAGGAAIPIDACVTAALFDDDGGHIDAGARFTAEAVEDLPGGAGVLVTEGAAPDTRGEDPFVYTVDDDLVNALLYDAWAAGEPLAPEGEAGGAITSDLPPVLMIGEAAEGEPPEMFLAVGEVIIGVPTEGGEATTAVSAMIPAEAAADGQVLFLGPAVDAEVAQMDMTVEVLDAPEGADHDAIVAGAEDRFAAEVVAGMAEQPVEFELPEMPIDNFGSPELDGGTLGMAPPQSEPVAAGEGGDHIMVGAPADFSAPPEAEAD